MSYVLAVRRSPVLPALPDYFKVQLPLKKTFSEWESQFQAWEDPQPVYNPNLVQTFYLETQTGYVYPVSRGHTFPQRTKPIPEDIQVDIPQKLPVIDIIELQKRYAGVTDPLPHLEPYDCNEVRQSGYTIAIRVAPYLPPLRGERIIIPLSVLVQPKRDPNAKLLAEIDHNLRRQEKDGVEWAKQPNYFASQGIELTWEVLTPLARCAFEVMEHLKERLSGHMRNYFKKIAPPVKDIKGREEFYRKLRDSIQCDDLEELRYENLLKALQKRQWEYDPMLKGALKDVQKRWDEERWSPDEDPADMDETPIHHRIRSFKKLKKKPPGPLPMSREVLMALKEACRNRGEFCKRLELVADLVDHGCDLLLQKMQNTWVTGEKPHQI